MDPATVGLIGGIGGGVLGAIGGLIGTYFGIVHTKNADERRFMIRCSVAAWLLMIPCLIVPIVLVMTKVLPGWVALTILAVSMTAGMRAIPALNRRAAELRGGGELG